MDERSKAPKKPKPIPIKSMKQAANMLKPRIMAISGAIFPVWVITPAVPIRARKRMTEVTPMMNDAIPVPL